MGVLEEYTAARFGTMRVLTSTWDCTLTGKEWGREARHPPSCMLHSPLLGGHHACLQMSKLI